MFGIGMQEILLLGCLTVVPAVIVITVLLSRSSRDKREEYESRD